MKKILFSALALFAFGFANAQDKKEAKSDSQTSQGSWLIEANTGFGTAATANTGIYFSTTDGDTDYNVGLEGGYFVIDNLAVKVGLGYGGYSYDVPSGFGTTTSVNASAFSYKVGAKYYIMGMIPVQVDYSGASGDGVEHTNPFGGTETPSYLGVQAGYAWFLGRNVSVEPGVRYNMSLNDQYAADDTIQVNIGFALHF